MPRQKEFDDRLLIRINKAEIESLDEIAAGKGLSRSKLVRKLIQHYIRRQKPKGS